MENQEVQVQETAASKVEYSFSPDLRAGKVREGECFQSSGKVWVNGTEIAYHTDAQDYLFLDDSGEPEASMFLISQFRDTDKSAERPVLFVFNGGPGMTMADMYTTMFGPKLLKTGDADSCKITAPFQTVPNGDWLLDICDIVLIDPVGCGYGQLLQQDAAPKYYSVEGDAFALAKLIAYWLAKYHRYNSPKYICGVSYGGVRCGVLPAFLLGGALHASQQIMGISLNGVISMSDCMTYNFETMEMNVDGNPAQVSILPTCAATNHFHHPEGKPELDMFIDEAARWGQEVYKPFLLNLENATEAEKESVAEKLSYYIGIPAEMLLAMNFEYEAYAYTNTLLAGEGKAAGYYDGRFTMQGGGIATPTFDPIYDDAYLNRFWPATTAVAMDAFANELGVNFREHREFVTENFAANAAWNYATTNHTGILDLHMGNLRHNPEMRQLMVAGKYDFCYPIANARYGYEQLRQSFGDRVTYLEAESGHEAFYMDSSRKALTAAIRKFLQGPDA